MDSQVIECGDDIFLPLENEGMLTTHILDTSRGVPGAGITIRLFRLSETGDKELLITTNTNADGRTDDPLLKGESMTIGRYELVFNIGVYFSQVTVGVEVPQPPFLDQIPIQFGISDVNAKYHIPLLVSPWSYSTYRGS